MVNPVNNPKNRKTADALHHTIQRLHNRESFRFLLAVWPDTWWWFIRLQAWLGDLPELDKTALEAHPSPLSAQRTEMLHILENVSEHGSQLENGKLRAAVLEEIQQTAIRLHHHSVSCRGKNGVKSVWPWESIAYPSWRSGCHKKASIDIQRLPVTETQNVYTENPSATSFVRQIVADEQE